MLTLGNVCLIFLLMNDEEKEKARIELVTAFLKMTKEEQAKIIKALEDAGILDKKGEDK